MEKLNRFLIIILALLFFGQGALFAQNIYWIESAFNAPRLVKNDVSGAEILSKPLLQGSLPQAIAANTKDGKLFWTGLSFINAGINSTSSDFKTDSTIVDSLSALRGIAVDAINNKIYWTSTNLVNGPVIMRANLDGTSADTLVKFGPGSNNTPRAIALDVNDGKIYWTNFGAGKIQRADFTTGADAEDVLSGLNGPCGLSIDTDSSKIFWTEINGQQIKSAGMNGQNVSILLDGLSYPNYISVDRGQNRMAWTELGTGSVKSAALDGSDIIDYKVNAIAPTGIVIEPVPVSAIEEKQALQIPEKFSLHQNYPNPFNPTTSINFNLPKNSFVKMEIFDLRGRKINVLLDDFRQAGEHKIIFDAADFASGIYVYSLKTNTGYNASKKMIIIK